MNYGFAFFPGQGAQAPGMGKDLYENSQAAKLVFEEASEGAGLDVAKLCFESDKQRSPARRTARSLFSPIPWQPGLH